MSDRPAKRRFAARPSGPENWVRSAKHSDSKRPEYTARLTIDITPELRGRIKISAFERGVTVADMLRGLLAREFPQPEGDQP